MNIPNELLQGKDVKPGDVVSFTVSNVDESGVELDDTSVNVEPAGEESAEPKDPNAPSMADVMKMPAKDMRKQLPVVSDEQN